MAHPTPLPLPLPLRIDLTESETPTPKAEKHNSTSLDETIELCTGGDFEWVPFLQATLVSLAWVFDAQQTFISIFTDAEPTWHCTSTNRQNSCNSSSHNICQLPRNSWAWDRPIDTSIVSEWSLECARSIITGLPASSFFMGCLAGGLILATLADSSLGRKKMLLLSCLLMSVSGLSTVFSTNIWTYAALRFVCGFGRATIGTCALVLSTELVGRRWRDQVGIIGFFCFTVGFISLPAIAYLNRGSSWRLLYLWTCIPTIIYCVLVHFLVRESPRWLFVRGRREEFLATLKSISPPSKRGSLTLSLFENVSIKENESWNIDIYSAIKMLLEKGWSLRRLLVVMVIGLGIGMVYYGMPLGVGSLAFNLYLSVTFNALSELPSSLATFFLIGRLKRKGSLLGSTLLSGICSVMCVVIRDHGARWMTTARLQIGLEMVSFFSACTAFNLLMIYTLELFPTCVRNSALSMVRQAMVLGGVFSPMLVAAGRKNGLLSYGVFGVTIGFCGLFVMILPETRGRTLSDTMDEEELRIKERRGAVALASSP